MLIRTNGPPNYVRVPTRACAVHFVLMPDSVIAQVLWRIFLQMAHSYADIARVLEHFTIARLVIVELMIARFLKYAALARFTRDVPH